MTRGIIVGVFPNKMTVSTEFNGDMMPDSKGSFLLDLLADCKTEEDFTYAIQKFDFRFFGYGKEMGEPILHTYRRYELDLKEHTFGFNDYLYIANFSGEDISVTDRENQKNMIPNGETAIYNYNKYEMTASEARQAEEKHISEIYNIEE